VNLHKVSRAILAIGTESVRESIATKVIALVCLAILGGAWWLILALWGAAKQWLGAMGLLGLLALPLAGCSLLRPPPCSCICTFPADRSDGIKEPVVHDVEDFPSRLDRLQAGKNQRSEAKRRFLDGPRPRKAKP